MTGATSLIAAGAAAARAGAADDLQAKLLALTKHGQPRLSLIDGGWYCVVEMTTAIKGATFRVDSAFGHATPSAAVDQVDTRIKDAIAAIGGAAA